MLKLLPQYESLCPTSVVPAEAVAEINSYIEQNACEILSIDISSMNIIDACYVSTLCSTTHYIKYPNGSINWRVSSDYVREFNKDLELGNSFYNL